MTLCKRLKFSVSHVPETASEKVSHVPETANEKVLDEIGAGKGKTSLTLVVLLEKNSFSLKKRRVNFEIEYWTFEKYN